MPRKAFAKETPAMQAASAIFTRASMSFAPLSYARFRYFITFWVALMAKPSVFTALCWLVVLNTFFFLRLDFALGLGVYVPVNFALHLAALTCYRSRKAPEA